MSEFDGKWKQAAGIPRGELVWIDPGRTGLKTHTAIVNGKSVAVIRTQLFKRGYAASVPGWVWTKPLLGSGAEMIGIRETTIKGFANLRTAKQAVRHAMDHLPPEEPLPAPS